MKNFLKSKLAALRAYLNTPAFKAQAGRAARLFAVTLLVAVIGLFKGHALTTRALGAAVVAAVEVVWRAFVPATATTPTPAVTENPSASAD